MSKIRGQEKGPGYPQAEALLADAMLKFGRELGEECNFGNVGFIVFHLLKVIKHGLGYAKYQSGLRYKKANWNIHFPALVCQRFLLFAVRCVGIKARL